MIHWPHQTFALAEVPRRIDAGARRLCLTSPTGGGKSRIAIGLIEWATARGWPTVFYTPRNLLIEQMIEVFDDEGLPFGVRASQFSDRADLSQPLQLSSPATENARCFERVRWQPHKARLVLVDEIHLQKGEVIRKLLKHHYDHGAVIVVITATPIGVSDLADELIVAGTNQELRACGALLPCMVYGCEEIDTSKIKAKQNGEFGYADIKSVWPAEIYGYVLDHYKQLNPDHKPTILFAPGVAESIWFAERFCESGFRFAHIDGEDCWLDGEFHKSDRNTRKRIIAGVRNGSILGVCNRFVMREGVDLPELYHGILATPIGSLVSYIQTVGRILRAHPSLDKVIIQDHGGNWWRHGSPNQNRDWEAYWTAPAHFATETRAERIRSKKEPEPIHCPQCQAIRLKGDTCPECNYRHTTKTRMVIQHTGKLKEMKGDIFRPRLTKRLPDTEEKWKRYYYSQRKAGRTFRQAEAWFFHEEHYWPPHDLKYMPKSEADWFRSISDVPQESLTATDPIKPKTREPALF